AVVVAQHLDGQVTPQVAVTAAVDDADAAAAHLAHQLVPTVAGVCNPGSGLTEAGDRNSAPRAGPGRGPGVGAARPPPRADRGLGHCAADVRDDVPAPGEARVVVAVARVVARAAAVVPVQEQELAKQGRAHGPAGGAHVLLRPRPPPRLPRALEAVAD